MALLRPCTTSAGFLATPEQSRRLDMKRLLDSLQADGYEMLVDARILVVVRRETECSIHDNGEVLLKTTDRDEAEAAYAGLRPHLQAAW